MRVEMPFKEYMKYLILAGKKHCSTRSKPYGSPGDYFVLDGKKFYFNNVEKNLLFFISEQYYDDEGFDSPEGFLAYWKDIHKKFSKKDLSKKYWLHEFRLGGNYD